MLRYPNFSNKNVVSSVTNLAMLPATIPFGDHNSAIMFINYSILYLSMSIINCNPSPFKNRSLLGLYIKAEHKQLKRFSIYSISSEADGS
jgi:hypothetical protein